MAGRDGGKGDACFLIACLYDNDFSAQRVIVAWKDTREARRAVSDALPVLKAAEEVFVVAIGDETRRAGVEDVAAYLLRHGREYDSAAPRRTCGRGGRDHEGDRAGTGGPDHL